MKRLLLASLLLMLLACIGAWLAWPYLMAWLRDQAAQAVTHAVGKPARIGQLYISVFPPEAAVHDVLVGEEGSPLLKLGSADVRLLPLTSVLQWRPAVTISVQTLDFDATQLPKAPPREGQEETNGGAPDIPAFRVKRLALKEARVKFDLDGVPATVSVTTATGQASCVDGGRRASVVVDVSDVGVERHNQSLRLREIRLQGGIDKGEPFVKLVHVEGEGIDAALSPAKQTHRYTVEAALDLQRVGALMAQPVEGRAQITGTVSGTLTDPDFDALLAVDGLVLAEHKIGDVKAQVGRKGKNVKVTDLSVEGPVGQLSGTMQITIAGELPIDGALRLRDVDLDALLAALGQKLEFGSHVTGTASVSGTLEPMNVNLQASGALEKSPAARSESEKAQNDPDPPAAVDDPPDSPTGESAAAKAGAGSPAPKSSTSRETATFNLNAHLGASGASVEAEVKQPEGNRLSAKVTSETSRLSGPVRIEVHDLAALTQVLPKSIRDLGLTGQVEGTVTLSGETSAPKIQANVSGKDMTIMGATVPAIAGDFTIEDSKLSTSGLTVQTQGGNAVVSGTLALGEEARNDWRVDIHNLDTDFVTGVAHPFIGSIPVSGGTINGTARIGGPWSHAAIDGSLTADSLYVAGEPVAHIAIQMKAELPQWNLEASIVHADRESVTVKGSGVGEARLQLAIDSTALNLASFRGAGRSRIAGTIEVHGQISGSFAKPQGLLTATGSHLAIGERQLGDVQLRASGKQDEWTVTGAAFQNALTLNGSVQLTRGYPYHLEVNLDHLRLGQFISADAALQVVSSGSIKLGGTLSDVMRPSGAVRITQLDVSREAYAVTAAEPIQIDVKDGRCAIRSFVLTAQGTRLRLTGGVTLSGEADLQARGDGDLVLLELVGRPISSARGEFTVTAHVQHVPGGVWKLGGQAQLRDAALDLGLPVAFTGVNGNFTLSASRVRVDSLDGKAGGGQFHVDGVVDLSSGPALSWKVQEVALGTDAGLEAQVSGHGDVKGSWKVMTVGGAVEVLNALYDRNVELTDLLPSLRASVQPAPRTHPPSVMVRFDLLVYASGGIYIDNNVAKAEMWLNLHLGGSTVNPELTGTIGFLNGQVTFRKRTFTITAGSIDFADRFRINPVLNITADSEISTADADYTVTVAVTGRAENPRVQLSADDPNLSENDILSLIAFGKTTAQLQREGGGISPADALALLPTGAATGQVGKLIGVDRFEVEATQSRATGAIEPRVTIGKDLTDRFRASVSSSFGVDAQRLVQLEYRLTRRISLLGTWEGETQSQAGAFGGDLKFRYEFRKLPLSLLPSGLETPSQDDAK